MNKATILLFLLFIASCAASEPHESQKLSEFDLRAQNACEGLARRHPQFSDGFTNRETRSLLHECVERGHMTLIPASISMLEPREYIDWEKSAGAELMEVGNIWYYEKDDFGRHLVSMNLLNLGRRKISDLLVGFSPTHCEKARENRWKYVFYADLEKDINYGQQAVATWKMPEHAPLDEGCMDILEVAQNEGAENCTLKPDYADPLRMIAEKADRNNLTEHGLSPHDIATISFAVCEDGREDYWVFVEKEKGEKLHFSVLDGHVRYNTIQKSYAPDWSRECPGAGIIAEAFKKDYCSCIRNHGNLRQVYNEEMLDQAIEECTNELR